MNNEKSINMKEKLRVVMKPGSYCDIISGDLIGMLNSLMPYIEITKRHYVLDGKCTGKTIVVDSNGMSVIDIPFNAEEPIIAIHADSRMA